MRIAVLSLLCVIACALVGAVPGLTGYWPMDDGAGNVVDECSGAAMGGEGRVQGNVTWEDTGRGPGLVFDGATTAVRIPSNPDWDTGEGELTVSLWLKLPRTAAGMILDHYFSGTPGVWGLVNEGGPTFALYNNERKPVKLRFPGFRYDDWQQVTVVWKRAKDGWLKAYLNGKPVQTLDGVACTAKYPFDLFVGGRQGTDQFSAGRFRELAIFNRALSDDEVADIYLNGIISATPLVISSLKTDKLLYGPAEKGTATLRVKNLTDAPQQAELVVAVISGLQATREIARTPLALPAKGMQTVSVPLAFQGEDYGCELRAQVVQKTKVLAEKRDFFSVSDNYLKVGIGSDWGGGLHTGLGQCAVVPDMARKLYSNYFEIFFWSPCDWALHVAPQKQWWSGQASYAEDEENLTKLIQDAHAQGIKVMMYANCNPSGPFGWEAARQHPEWFGGGGFGDHSQYNVEALDHWNDADWRKDKAHAGNPGWFVLPVDMRRLDAVDYGIDRIIDGAKRYNWDGVRYDGHYTIVGNDEMSTRNMRRLKERMHAALPNFTVGFNYGRAPEWLGLSHEMREGMAGGGLYLQEGIRAWRYTNDKYTSWKHYATNELRIAKLVYRMGGYYHCMWSDQNLKPEQAYYKLVYGLIAGGHPADSGIYANTAGCPLWGAFLTRWSGILWHPDIAAAPKEADAFTVAGDGLQWKELVQERVLSPTRKLVILHLVDPPAGDEIAKTAFPPAREADTACVVRYQSKGQSLRGAYLVSPLRAPFGEKVTAGKDGSYTLPMPRYWETLVLEVEGKFDLPKPAPAFTEAPDPAKLAWSPDQQVVKRLDPNKEELETPTDPNDTVIPLTIGGVNIGRVNIIDPDSPQGSVEWRDKTKASGAIGKFWTGPYPPGKYRASIRLKWLDAAEPPTPQTLTMNMMAERGEKFNPQPTIFVTPGTPNPPAGAIVLGDKGKYQDYVIGDIDTKKPEYFTFAGTATTAVIGENTLYAEKITVRLLERYTDAQVAEWSTVAKPDGLRAPNGLKPQQVLLVKGLFSDLYGIEKAVPCTAAYALPAKYEDLYAYDALVLSNLDFRTSAWPARRMIWDYVNDGGRLVLLGGNRGFGEGGMAGTYLGDLAPFVVKGRGEITQSATPQRLGAKPGVPYADAALLFWHHALVPKPGAAVLAYADKDPVAARSKAGKGVVTAFTGTVLGTQPAGAKGQPFWQTPSWTALLKRMIIE
jgi:uncharacterized membrane protein